MINAITFFNCYFCPKHAIDTEVCWAEGECSSCSHPHKWHNDVKAWTAMMGSNLCTWYVRSRHPSVCLSVLSSDACGRGVICFLGVIEGERMEFLGQLQHNFPWKGGREWDWVVQCSWRELYCTTWEGSNGTRASSLSPVPTKANHVSSSQQEHSQMRKRIWGPPPVGGKT